MKLSPVEIATFPLAPPGLEDTIEVSADNGEAPGAVAAPLGAGSSVVAERPPYCWKVDGDGNQRSDIDLVVYDVVQDPQIPPPKALAGENDMIAALTDDYGNKAVLFAGMERDGHRFIDMTSSDSNLANYAFNQMHEDPVLREVLRNKDFRAGLRQAINRQEIIDLDFIGQAQPLQTAVLPGYESLHGEKLATQYLDYDVAKANEYPDKAFPEKDDDGFRLGPDGNRIQFALLSRADKALVAYVGQMLVGYWRDVGVDTRFDVIDRSLARFRKNANQHYAIIEYFPGGARDAFLRPTPWGPMHHNAVYGFPWFDCYRAEGGEEPPENIMRQIELWKIIDAAADQEARVEMMREILADAVAGC